MEKSESIVKLAAALSKFQGEVKNPPNSANNEIEVGFDHKNIEYIVTKNGCYECTSHYKDKDGYPKITINKRQRTMSRYIYERFVGIIPKGNVIRHKCDCASCINPNHLEIGTQIENIEDKVIRNRQARGENIGISKLNRILVDEIRQAIEPISILASKYKVANSTIRRIKNNELWRA